MTDDLAVEAQPRSNTNFVTDMINTMLQVDGPTDEGNFASRSDTSQPNASPFAPKKADIVVLDVGGTKFKALRSTFVETSRHLRAIMSDDRLELQRQEPQDDGSYWVEGDPDLFPHLPCFMRNPGTFPLFWSPQKGFNYNLYNQLEKQARYFKIDELEDWIKKKMYEKAIYIHVSEPRVETLSRSAAHELPGNVWVERYVVKDLRHIYVCPRGTPDHRGHPNRCSWVCFNSTGNQPTFDTEEWIRVLTIDRRLWFDANVCSVDLSSGSRSEDSLGRRRAFSCPE